LSVAGTRGNALKIPVAGMVGGVLCVTVGVGGIAAVSIERAIQVGKLRRGREGGAIDVGVDDVDTGAGVHGDGRQQTAVLKVLNQEMASKPASALPRGEQARNSHARDLPRGCPGGAARVTGESGDILGIKDGSVAGSAFRADSVVFARGTWVASGSMP